MPDNPSRYDEYETLRDLPDDESKAAKLSEALRIAREDRVITDKRRADYGFENQLSTVMSNTARDIGSINHRYVTLGKRFSVTRQVRVGYTTDAEIVLTVTLKDTENTEEK